MNSRAAGKLAGTLMDHYGFLIGLVFVDEAQYYLTDIWDGAGPALKPEMRIVADSSSWKQWSLSMCVSVLHYFHSVCFYMFFSNGVENKRRNETF